MVLIICQYISYLIYSSSDTIQNNLEFVLIPEVFRYSHFVWKQTGILLLEKSLDSLLRCLLKVKKKGKKVNNWSKHFTVLDIDELLGNQIITIILML